MSAEREALEMLVDVIESAGLTHLANGVQLGQTSWLIKANDAVAFARQALNQPPLPTGEAAGCPAEQAGTARRCIVAGCTNDSRAGRFVGELCAPCYRAITTGEIGPTTSFLGKITAELARAREKLAATLSERDKLVDRLHACEKDRDRAMLERDRVTKELAECNADWNRLTDISASTIRSAIPEKWLKVGDGNFADAIKAVVKNMEAVQRDHAQAVESCDYWRNERNSILRRLTQTCADLDTCQKECATSSKQFHLAAEANKTLMDAIAKGDTPAQASPSTYAQMAGIVCGDRGFKAFVVNCPECGQEIHIDPSMVKPTATASQPVDPRVMACLDALVLILGHLSQGNLDAWRNLPTLHKALAEARNG